MSPPYDLAIRHARVVDGSGAPGYHASVYVRDGLVANIATDDHARPAEAEIEAQGLVLAPGFIDVHTHDDVALLVDPRLPPKTCQGVTSVVVGLCGYSPAPLPLEGELPGEYAILLGERRHRFARFADYLAALDAARPAVNWLPLVGHSSLRLSAMEDLDRPASEAELVRMEALLDEALAAGAVGLSTGLAYAMARAAPSGELVRLCARMRGHGFYVTHLRDEGAGLLASVEEALAIGRESGTSVVFSHHKALGPRAHGLTRASLALIEEARASQEVALDVYPYTFSSTSLTRERAARGGTVVVTRSERLPHLAGRTLDAIAEELCCTPLEAVDRLVPAGALYHLMDEADVRRVLAHPLAMIGSDGLPFDPHPHPRLWGTFPRVLSAYVCDDPLLTLETAIHRMTGLPARVFRLEKRGLVREGFVADLVLFDPARIRDHASATDPTAPPSGIMASFVAGRPPALGTGGRLVCAPPA